MPLALVKDLDVFNFRDPAGTLRKIADQIDRGELGEVGTIGIVALGKECFVYGAGVDSSAPAVGLLLHAGFLKMSREIADYQGE